MRVNFAGFTDPMIDGAAGDTDYVLEILLFKMYIKLLVPHIYNNNKSYLL